MLPSAEEFPTLLADECTPHGVRLLGRVEGAEVSRRFAGIDARLVSFASSQIDALQRGLAVAAVPPVLLSGCLAQILPTIIRRISVLMIKRHGFVPGLDYPDHALCFEENSVDRYTDISIFHRHPGNHSGPSFIPPKMISFALEMMQRARLPRQYSTVGIIQKTLAQVFCIRQRLRLHHQSFAGEPAK